VNAGAGVRKGQLTNPTKPGFCSTDAELPPGSMVFIDARMCKIMLLSYRQWCRSCSILSLPNKHVLTRLDVAIAIVIS
jgi:hypothetical protein